MKMAPALPSVDSRRNGLNDLTRQLVEEPTKPLVCIVILDSNQMLVDHDKHTRTPTARIHHIEPMLTRDMRTVAIELLTKAYTTRTHEQLELEYDLDIATRWDEDGPVHL